jgi:Tol biopolymer transport system component/DNA-binding winged helix-turn-helix (wHTH) protein
LESVPLKYRWDDFVLDLEGFRLERAGVQLALEPKAFNLLVLLMGRPGHVFTKQEIFEQLWPGTVVTDHALTRVVAQLRRVLGDEARDGRYIETVPTRGYRWLPKVEAIESGASAAPVAPAELIAPGSQRQSRFPVVALGLTVAIILLALAAWSQQSAPAEVVERAPMPPANVAWPVQLTTHSGLDLHPSFSPQGDAIAYASDRSGSFELYVRALSGTANEVPLTQDGRGNVQPSWSPDGSLIAFHSHGRGIWVMPARGGVARQLGAEGSHPAWSADGRRIVFQSDEPSDVTPSAFGAQSGGTIQMVDVDGNYPRQLTSAGQPLGGHAYPVWSRDGRFVAFSVFDGGRNNGVWRVAVESGEILQLVKGMRGHYELAFAPGDKSLYAAGGDPFISRIPFDPRTGNISGERELIAVAGVASVRGLTMSPDGQRLGLTGLTIASQIWAQPIGQDGNRRGDPRTLTTDTSRRNSLPVVSPDGSRVAYVSTRGGEAPNVWVIDTDGKNVTQLTDNEGPDIQPYWYPDGRRVAFLSTREDGLGLWSVSLDTRRQELIRPLADLTSKIRNGADGIVAEAALARSMTEVALALVAPPYANRQLFIGSMKGLDVRAVSEASRWVGYPAWSRDEKHLAAELKTGSSTHAAVIDLDSGAMRQLTNERGQTWVRSWSPDGMKIAAAIFRGGRWSLEWIDAAGGTTGAITASSPANGYVRYPDWSPRGDLVVYERGELHGNIWILRLADRSE